jgi:hypothetical protein
MLKEEFLTEYGLSQNQLALAAQRTDFDFDHVQLAGVLGDIMELEPAQHPPCFTRGKGVVERARRVRRQIVQDDSDALRLWEVNVSKLAHADGEVHGGAAVADFDLAPGPMHVEEDERWAVPLRLYSQS